MNLLTEVERELIIRALAETGGNQVKASLILGLTRAAMRKRVEKYGLQKPEST
jgi:DNA-binding protein Fis